MFDYDYRPGILERFVTKFEDNRTDVMYRLIRTKKGVFVDLACGDGQFLNMVKGRFKALYGFDISRSRINNAKKKFKDYKKVKLAIKDLDQGVPLMNSSVDTVVCEASLAYFIRPDLLIGEVSRVLKPGGEFIVQIANYAYLPRRLALLFGKLPKTTPVKGFGDGGMIHHFTYASLKELLGINSFKITNKENSGILAKYRKIWQELLASDIIYRSVKIKKIN